MRRIARNYMIRIARNYMRRIARNYMVQSTHFERWQHKVMLTCINCIYSNIRTTKMYLRKND